MTEKPNSLKDLTIKEVLISFAGLRGKKIPRAYFRKARLILEDLGISLREGSKQIAEETGLDRAEVEMKLRKCPGSKPEHEIPEDTREKLRKVI